MKILYGSKVSNQKMDWVHYLKEGTWQMSEHRLGANVQIKTA